MKKIGIICFVLIGLFFLTGCDQTNTQKGTTNTSNEQVHEHCVRAGKIDDESKTDLTYELYYTGDRINRIESKEIIISTNSAVLDTYEEAFRKIHSYYDGLEHYDTNLTRTKNRVTSIMRIDYDHIDIDALIAIEGENDNIFENKVPLVSKYRELTKKLGTTCTKVSS